MRIKLYFCAVDSRNFVKHPKRVYGVVRWTICSFVSPVLEATFFDGRKENKIGSQRLGYLYPIYIRDTTLYPRLVINREFSLNFKSPKIGERRHGRQGQ